MFRDGSSDVVSTDATIRTTTALVTYRRDAWDDRERNQEWVMVAFDLMREQLVVAAALNRWWVIDDLIVRDPQRPAQEPRLASVSTEVDPLLPFSFGGKWCDFRYAERPWRPSDDDGAGDIAFVCQRLHAACQIWDRNA